MLRVGSKKMTPQDDRLAALLVELGFSFRRIASLMEITDKTAKAAVERVRNKESVLPARTKKKAQALLDFYRWLEEGREKNYLKALAAHLEGDEEGVN